MLAILLAAALGFAARPSTVHDFHVSRLTVNYNTAEQRLELTLDTFIDDLEFALGRPAGAAVTPESLDLVSPTEHPLADSLLAAYLRRTIELSGVTPLVPRYIGKEAADDPYAVYAYLTVDAPGDPAGWEALSIESTYLLELYADQQNIIVWQRDGRVVDYDLLTAGQRTARLDP